MASDNNIDRRKFLKTVGSAGLASVIGQSHAKKSQKSPKAPAKIGHNTLKVHANAVQNTNETPLNADPNSNRSDPNTPKNQEKNGKKPEKAPENNQKPAEKTQKTEIQQLAKRKLGKTGIEISSLSLGTNRFYGDNQIILRKAFEMGVRCWDTSPMYGNGSSETGIGEFIKRNPNARKDLLIATKATHARSIEDIDRLLKESLARMRTDYVDIYYGVHQISRPGQLTDELKNWVKKAKEQKLIRFFGFSVHKNMAHCLNAASKLDWIDVILMSYNFRLMQDKLLMSAIDACHKAGIGLIAMKTQGHGVGRPEETFRGRHSISTEADKKLVAHLLKSGYTKGQAKIKLVLEDERISSACVGVKNVSLLRSNVSSIMDPKKLSQVEKSAFSDYAKASCSGYCAGCAEICEPASEGLPISDIMRYLMYYKDYGDTEGAKELFGRIPRKIIRRLSSVDYSAAESLCPQHLPIGALIEEATKKLC